MSVGRRDFSEVKMLATKSEDPSFITKTQNEKEKDDSCKMSSDLTSTYCHTHVHTNTHRHTKRRLSPPCKTLYEEFK